MKGDHYLYLSQSDSKDYFPGNKAHDFVVKLTPPVVLEDLEDWSVAITELQVVPEIPSSFIVCCDLCQASHVGEKQLPVLRLIHPWVNVPINQYLFTDPYRIQIKQKVIDTIHIYITDEQGELMSLEQMQLRCTLQLRKYSIFT